MPHPQILSGELMVRSKDFSLYSEDFSPHYKLDGGCTIALPLDLGERIADTD